ncbi:ribonuclease Z [Lysinibacillus piscis]|uniref:Ribonuclease Z n=1 Tax=Lysinibacillus piscis TaxID=2518931 RepID=A0ABQ5NLK8_9BACI|nr:ribonuclease Z [Lysinibacillus sp. KH24]GLC89248.1 ribonuclease Z [Lysinibacillus sp. KH24]
MQLHFLGTGAGMPSKERNTSALMVKLLDEVGEMWLVDCGEATQHQILYTSLKPRKVTKIFITHLHGDHIFGLPGFLSSRSFQGGDEPLTIFGPKGLQQWLEQTFALSKTHLTYPIHFVEVHDGIVYEDAHFIVYAQSLRHVVPCFGYRIEQKELPGELLMEKVQTFGVPKGPLLGQLKQGQDVMLSNGTVVKAIDVVAPPRKGFTLTILGDTKYCDEAIILAKQADIVIHEATFDGHTTELAASYGHSTNVEAAMVAKQAGAQTLLLNHLSARFLPQDLPHFLAEAQAIFPQTYLTADQAVFSWGNNQLSY